jgi:PGF-CTERM protein
MNWKALTMATMLVVAAGAAVVPASATQQSSTGTAQQGSASAQSGAFVSFETTDDAVVDYAVNGETVVENVTVQAASESQSDTGLGGDVDLGADVGFEAAGLDLASSLSASGAAEITTESGATIEAHDNRRGVLVVQSGGDSQVAQLNVSASSDAETASDQRAVITTDDGTRAVVIATGNGSVAVTDDGDVRAETGSDGEVVYRQYDGDRSESEQNQERMIANGTATASVYVQQAADAGESGSDDARETTTSVVQYGEDTTVDVTQQTASRVNATVERSQSEGRVVIVTVADEAFESAENAEVYVDGEAAVQADSYSAVRSAADGGEQSAFLVEQSASAEATTDVVVGINHFSARDLSLVSGDAADGSDDSTGDDSTTTTDDGAGSGDDTTASGDESGSDATDTGTTAGTGPGFGVTVALAALAALGLFAGRRD